jgi:hypothetical protein
VDVRGLNLDALVVIRHGAVRRAPRGAACCLFARPHARFLARKLNASRSQVDVYPRECGIRAPVGTGLNRPAVVTLAERGVLAAAAAAQPAAAAAGAVALRLARRGEDGRLTVWPYEVPLAGGTARELAVKGCSGDEADATQDCTDGADATAEAFLPLPDGAGAPPEAAAAAEQGEEADAAAVAAAPPALRLSAPRTRLDDVDD